MRRGSKEWKEYQLNVARELARQRGGECLSETYEKARSDLLWRCHLCHEPWPAPLYSIKGGSWCPTCKRDNLSRSNRGDYSDLPERFHEMNSTLLTPLDQIRNAHMTLKAICERNHPRWKPTPDGIRAGKKCGECRAIERGISQRVPFAEVVIAVTRLDPGGRCLTDEGEYIGVKTKLTFQCSRLHAPFIKTLEQLRMFRWCGTCLGKKSLGERICQLLFEQVFGGLFPDLFPRFLRWRNGSLLQLDGYNAEWGVAFEYDGYQHRTKDNHHHKGNKKKFQEQQERSEFKKLECPKQNILLFVIDDDLSSPMKPKQILEKMEDIRLRVIKTCQQAGKSLPVDASTKTLSLENLYSSIDIKPLLEAALKRGWKCLKTGIISRSTPVSWQCIKNPSHPIREMTITYACKHSCLKCVNLVTSRLRRVPFQRIQAFIIEHWKGDLELLSGPDDYCNSESKLRIRCLRNPMHGVFSPSWDNIKQAPKRGGKLCGKCGDIEMVRKKQKSQRKI